MNQFFREFFNNEKINFNLLDKKTIVIFDSNTLLNIYNYSYETRRKFVDSLEKIQTNIWAPYHAMLEFNLQRQSKLFDLNNLHKTTEELIHNVTKKNSNSIVDLINKINLKSTDVAIKKKEAIDEIETILTPLNKIIKDKAHEILELANPQEDYAKMIGELFKNRIGDPYTQDRINEISAEAIERYSMEIPPGYKDDNKQDFNIYNGVKYQLKHGDLIIWNQILDKAKEDNIEKVIFITDDLKEDWWYTLNKKILGPRAELKNELLRISKADLFMFSSNSFLKQISSHEKNFIEEAIDTSSDYFFNNHISDVSDFGDNFHFSYDLANYIPDYDIKNYLYNYTWLESNINYEKQVLNTLNESIVFTLENIDRLNLELQNSSPIINVEVTEMRLKQEMQKLESLKNLSLHQKNKLDFFNHELNFFIHKLS